MRAKKRWSKIVAPVERYCRLAKSWALNPYRNQCELKLNVGCGRNVKAGWINVDLYNSPEIFFWDIRYRWPFADGSASLILAEHVFEHLTYPKETSRFLRECKRCLFPNGTLRISVPDAGKYLYLYASGSWDGIIEARPLTPDHTDRWLRITYRTRMEFINAVFRQNGQHQYAYDIETLLLVLTEAGFDATPSSCGPLDRLERAGDSLYVNASPRV